MQLSLHAQVPVATEQDWEAAHGWQGAPFIPQAALVGGVMHCLLVVQHPPLQFDASQVGGTDEQLPVLTSQNIPAPQSLQAPPLRPQAELVGGSTQRLTGAVASQQPLHQEGSQGLGTQVPVAASQVVPTPQLWQASPFLPQAASSVPGRQDPAAQQPVVQPKHGPAQEPSVHWSSGPHT